jgi:predicted HicB family RNase H-like nuclease
MAQIHLELSDRLRRDIKVAAAQEGVTMRAWIVAALEAALAQRPKGRRS